MAGWAAFAVPGRVLSVLRRSAGRGWACGVGYYAESCFAVSGCSLDAKRVDLLELRSMQ